MKIKYSTGTEYLLNYIQSSNDHIELIEFVNDALAQRFTTELVIYWNIWKDLILEKNAKN